MRQVPDDTQLVPEPVFLPPPPLWCLMLCRLGDQCKGNRLEWVEGSNKTKLLACFPHHKNEARWDHMPIEFQVPPALAQAIMPWLVHGHQMVVPNSRHLFVHLPSGLPLSNVNFSQWWQAMISKFEAPFKFPPSQLRHIFVDERCGTDHVDGPEMRGAARVMGNCVERWAISYDRNIHSREVKAAVEAMDAWRMELLALVDDD